MRIVTAQQAATLLRKGDVFFAPAVFDDHRLKAYRFIPWETERKLRGVVVTAPPMDGVESTVFADHYEVIIT